MAGIKSLSHNVGLYVLLLNIAVNKVFFYKSENFYTLSFFSFNYFFRIIVKIYDLYTAAYVLGVVLNCDYGSAFGSLKLCTVSQAYGCILIFFVQIYLIKTVAYKSI